MICNFAFVAEEDVMPKRNQSELHEAGGGAFADPTLAYRRRRGRRGKLAAGGEATNIDSMNDCIEDARLAALDGDTGPEAPTEFAPLRGRLETARSAFPPLYRSEFVEPYIAKLDQLGPTQFAQI